MKKKGFTLIELLAVIVVLAVIALIATPIVLNLINNARVGAAEQSVTGYVKAIENTIMKDMINNKEVSDGTYKYNSIEADVSGKRPTSGKYTVKNGRVESGNFCVDGYYIEYKNSVSKKISDTCEVLYQVYENGTAIYFNPETGKVCNQNDAVSATGTKTGCMKWYTFNDEGSKTETVNMILDHNTTAGVAYNSTGSNNEMKEVKTALESDTSTWDKSLKARLITANEVAKITGNISFDSSEEQDWFCLDTNQVDRTNNCKKNQGTSKFKWLFSNLSNCTDYGCESNSSEATNGYWTSTKTKQNPVAVWFISSFGSLDFSNVISTNVGIRPVITVFKDIFE